MPLGVDSIQQPPEGRTPAVLQVTSEREHEVAILRFPLQHQGLQVVPRERTIVLFPNAQCFEDSSARREPRR